MPKAGGARRNTETGLMDTLDYEADKTADDLADTKARAKMSTTAGADLEGVARRLKEAGAPKAEMDPDKMSPLARMAYLESKKKKQASAADAGDAIALRNR